MDMIRRIKKEEKVFADRMRSIAFNFILDESKKDQVMDSPTWPEDWTWGYFEDSRMVSCMTAIPYAMRFDGHTVAMTGIGGVASLPETRHGGKIRKIFEVLFKEEYEKGTEFTGLTPFSHSYYRKFGYELCNDRKEIVIEGRTFKKLKPIGKFVQHFPGDPTDILQMIHEKYIRDINQTIVRNHWADDLAWRLFTNSNPYKDSVYTYIWYDDHKTPRGYVSFRREMNGMQASLIMREIIYMDGEALYNLLAFFSQLSFAEFRWDAPVFTPIADIFTENWDFKQNLIPRDMLRVIHVQRVLEKMRQPKGSGSYVVEIEDSMIQENCGRFLVEYSPERKQVSKTDRTADMNCDIPALSQLVSGYRTLDDLLLCKEGIQIYKNKELLSDVFTSRRSHLSENF